MTNAYSKTFGVCSFTEIINNMKTKNSLIAKSMGAKGGERGCVMDFLDMIIKSENRKKTEFLVGLVFEYFGICEMYKPYKLIINW